MKVRIRLLGFLREFLPPEVPSFDDTTLDLADGLTVGGLAARLGFRTATDFMVMLNGQHLPGEDWDRKALVAGDEVVFVPPIKGGDCVCWRP